MLIRSRSPLRLGLAGGGTDVSPFCDLYGGVILNATIDSYAYASLELLDNGTVDFVSADRGEHATYPAMPQIPFDGTLDLFKAVYNYVVREHNGNRPISLRLSSQLDVPMGSGLGGSSTLVVAMLNAYAELLNLPFGEYELARAAYRIERIEAGLHGGKQDQYAAAFGGFNFMEFGANDHVLVNPLRIKDWIVSELEASMVLFYTGQSRASAEIIRQQSDNVQSGNTLAIDAMHRLKEEAFRMKECLLRGDFPALHEVLRESWTAKKQMAAGISNDRIDALYERALDAGAYCGKISGAGSGGFMMFLADPPKKMQVVQALRSLHDDGLVFACHFTQLGTQAWRVR